MIGELLEFLRLEYNRLTNLIESKTYKDEYDLGHLVGQVDAYRALSAFLENKIINLQTNIKPK